MAKNKTQRNLNKLSPIEQAHKLFTPLTTINGYIQLLQIKVAKNSKEQEWLKEMSTETKRLTQMIREIFHR